MPKSLWLMAESEPEKRAWAEAVEVALVRSLSVLLPAVLCACPALSTCYGCVSIYNR